jgi:hypothetical protein
MSSAEVQRTYSTDAATLRAAIIEAASAVRLTKVKPDTAAVEISEPFRLLAFTWPAKLVATFSDVEGGVTVHYKASNFGFGPIQSGHIRKKLEHVTTALAQYER